VACAALFLCRPATSWSFEPYCQVHAAIARLRQVRVSNAG
jgi:hypothetical protein